MSTYDDQQTIGRIRALSHVEPSDEATRRALDRVRAALLDQPKAEAARQEAPRAKRTFLRAGPITIVGTAAACLVGVIVGAALFQSWGSIALADVQEKLEVVENVTLTMRNEGQPHTYRVIATRSGMMRTDGSNGNVHVVNSKQGRSLFLQAKEKKATLLTYFPSHNDLPQNLFVNLLMKLRSMFREEAIKSLPDREIDGKRAVGFLVALNEPRALKGMEAGVWVDPHTHLPVRLEMRRVYPSPSGKPRTVPKGVWEDIVFDTQIDESLFDTTPPAGFSIDSSGLAQVQRDPLPPLVLTPKVGIGDVRFGMSKEEVIQILGQPEVLVREKRGEPEHLERNLKDPAFRDFQESTREMIRAWKTSPEYLVGYDILKYNSSGLWLTVCPDRGLYYLEAQNRAIGGACVQDFVGKTAEGIALGASIDDIEKVYGPTDRTLLPKDGVGAVFYMKLGLTFNLIDDKLCKIGANSIPSSNAPSTRARESQTLRF